MRKIEKFDKLVYGLGLGILAPMLSIIIVWRASADDSFLDFLKGFQSVHKLSNLVSLSGIPNLLMFFIFIWLNLYRSARGVILATFLLVIIVVILKLL